MNIFKFNLFLPILYANKPNAHTVIQRHTSTQSQKHMTAARNSELVSASYRIHNCFIKTVTAATFNIMIIHSAPNDPDEKINCCKQDVSMHYPSSKDRLESLFIAA